MTKRKLQQFREFSTFNNTFEFSEENKGNWSNIFGNNNPIVLELACGYGHYATELGKLNPNINYIGIDRKANRMWHGAKESEELGLNNVLFLRTPIDNLLAYFAKDEVESIWITFPDPQPKDKSAKNRLIHPRFLAIYKQIIKGDGLVHLKTDSDLLYIFCQKVVKDCEIKCLANLQDIYATINYPDFLNIKTYYEKIWLKQGKTIKYLAFELKNAKFDWISDMRKYY